MMAWERRLGAGERLAPRAFKCQTMDHGQKEGDYPFARGCVGVFVHEPPAR